MSYFKPLQRNKRKRINSIKHEPVFHNPAITKQVAVSNTREAGNLIVKERFIERERARSEYEAERTAKLVADTAKKIERTTGMLQVHDDTKGVIAKLKGMSRKGEQNGDLNLPEIVLSSPQIQRSRLTTWPKDNRERKRSVDINMNNVRRERLNSTESSGFDRKTGNVYQNAGLPTIITKPCAATFTVASLNARQVSNELSFHEIKDRPRSATSSILSILARQRFASRIHHRCASTGRFEDVKTTATNDNRKLNMSRSRSNSASCKDLATKEKQREKQAFHRSKQLPEDSQSRSRSSSLLSLPDSKYSFDSEDSWPQMDDTVFEDSKK